MFNGFSPKTIDFMWNLRLNNNKPWFEAHKDEFIRDFQTPLKALGREVFERVTAKHDRGFIHKVSRIYKDARRIRDGEPYRANLWFSIEKPVPDNVQWTGTPVFWFELAPDEWSYGMGYYAAKAETMANLRARIDEEPKKFEKFITPLNKQNEFVLEGDEYKRRKEPAMKLSETAASWYNKKSFSLIHKQKNGKELYSRDLAERLVKGYEFLMPFYDYFIVL
ncbi:MAG: DUF2461 domain-containing protein [Oscillospiraceae bacterium]|jgi:uncharacterized protein (TIGR02453 family)|nr:DUF2461 domain-containing protein [Oscillospiraceae bacterium]